MKDKYVPLYEPIFLVWIVYKLLTPEFKWCLIVEIDQYLNDWIVNNQAENCHATSKWFHSLHLDTMTVKRRRETFRIFLSVVVYEHQKSITLKWVCFWITPRNLWPKSCLKFCFAFWVCSLYFILLLLFTCFSYCSFVFVFLPFLHVLCDPDI